MAEDKLDKHIREQLYNHPSTVDSENLWKQIQIKQNVEEDDRKPIWLWLIPFLLIGVVASIFLLNSISNSVLIVDLNQPESSNQNKLENSTQVISNNELSLKQIDDNAEKSEINSNNNTEPSNTASIIQLDASSDDQTLNSNAQANKELTNSKQSANKPISIKELSSSSKNKAAEELKQTIKNGNNTEFARTSRENTSDNSLIDEEMKSEFSNNGGLANDVTSKSELTINRASDDINILSSTKDQENIEETVYIARESIQLESIEKLKPNGILWSGDLEFDNLSFKPSPAPYFSSRNNWESSLGFNFAFGLTDKKLSSLEDEAYLQRRLATETSLESIRLALDYRLMNGAGLYFKIGAEYEQINERFDLVDQRDTTFLSPNEVVQIVVDQNGDSTKVFGEAMVTETYSYKKKIFNEYRFLDIPVFVGYAYSNNNFEYFIELGLAANLSFSTNGEILDPQGVPTSLSDPNAAFFKANAGFSLMGNFGINYYLSDRIGLSFAPSLKFRLGSISSVENPISQKYTSFGFSTGLRYRF